MNIFRRDVAWLSGEAEWSFASESEKTTRAVVLSESAVARSEPRIKTTLARLFQSRGREVSRRYTSMRDDQLARRAGQGGAKLVVSTESSAAMPLAKPGKGEPKK